MNGCTGLLLHVVKYRLNIGDCRLQNIINFLGVNQYFDFITINAEVTFIPHKYVVQMVKICAGPFQNV